MPAELIERNGASTGAAGWTRSPPSSSCLGRHGLERGQAWPSSRSHPGSRCDDETSASWTARLRQSRCRNWKTPTRWRALGGPRPGECPEAAAHWSPVCRRTKPMPRYAKSYFHLLDLPRECVPWPGWCSACAARMPRCATRRSKAMKQLPDEVAPIMRALAGGRGCRCAHLRGQCARVAAPSAGRAVVDRSDRKRSPGQCLRHAVDLLVEVGSPGGA
jgi:hypothetical protein